MPSIGHPRNPARYKERRDRGEADHRISRNVERFAFFERFKLCGADQTHGLRQVKIGNQQPISAKRANIPRLHRNGLKSVNKRRYVGRVENAPRNQDFVSIKEVRNQPQPHPRSLGDI